MKKFVPKAGIPRRLWIESGEYRVKCIAVKEKEWAGEVTSLIADFEIMDGVAAGLEISTWWNTRYKVFSPDTRYHQEWVIANGGIEPKPGEGMPTDIFIGKTFLAKIGDNKPKPNKKKTNKKYSKVTEILELIEDGS